MRANHTFLSSCVLLSMVGCGEVVPPGGLNAADAGPQPLITEVSPDRGPIIGGIEVTISGANFEAGEAGDAQVVVGGVIATDVAVAGDGTMTFTLPPGTEEGAVVDITVFNQNGFARFEDAFQYNLRPSVLSISPEIGRGAGGANVTITGRGFEDFDAGTPTITIAGAEATNVVVVDDQTITATTGASTAPAFVPQDVVISNLNGADTLPSAFRVSQPGLLAFERSGQNRIFYLDPANPQPVEIARATRRVNNCATSPAGTVFCEGRRPSDNQRELMTLNPLTGTVTPIGLLTLSAQNRGLEEMTYVGNTLYGLVQTLGCCGNPIGWNFVTVNTADGALTSVGTWAAAQVRGAGITAKDANTLWYVDMMNETLDSMSLTGAVTAGTVALTGQANSTRSLVTVDGQVYMSDRNRNRIYRIDTTTGAVTDFATFSSVSRIQAMTPTPATF